MLVARRSTLRAAARAALAFAAATAFASAIGAGVAEVVAGAGRCAVLASCDDAAPAAAVAAQQMLDKRMGRAKAEKECNFSELSSDLRRA